MHDDADAADLARKLTQGTWCCCNGFELRGYLWLNDATSADGPQEYAVIKCAGPDGGMLQIESITFSWCSYEQALAHVERTLRRRDDGDDFAVLVSPACKRPRSTAAATFWRLTFTPGDPRGREDTGGLRSLRPRKVVEWLRKEFAGTIRMKPQPPGQSRNTRNPGNSEGDSNAH